MIGQIIAVFIDFFKSTFHDVLASGVMRNDASASGMGYHSKLLIITESVDK